MGLGKGVSQVTGLTGVKALLNSRCESFTRCQGAAVKSGDTIPNLRLGPIIKYGVPRFVRFAGTNVWKSLRNGEFLTL